MLDLGDQFFNNTKDKIFIKVSSLLYCAVVEKVNNYSDLDLLFWNWTLTFLKSLFYLLQWKAFKNDEKASYFILKALSVLKIFTFLVMWVNGLIRKLKLISKFTMLQSGKQTITIYILPNIWRSKSNQKMKFGR